MQTGKENLERDIMTQEGERLDPNGLVNYPRVKLATRFLDEVLVPELKEGHQLGVEQIKQLIGQFQEANLGRGSDFSLDHVWGAAWKRIVSYERLQAENPSELPSDASVTFHAWKLLTSIELGEMEDS